MDSIKVNAEMAKKLRTRHFKISEEKAEKVETLFEEAKALVG